MSDATTGMQPSRIPEFANLEEEAAFWDTHDTTDFKDEFHPVTVLFEVRLCDDQRSRHPAEEADTD
jgi:hypothetical protein